MPPFVRSLISFLVGWPAAWARVFGLGFAYLEGLILLTGRGGTGIAFFGLSRVGHPLLAALAFALWIVGYLMEALVAYVTSENREALPPRRVALLVLAAIGIQSFGLAAACLLAVALFRGGSSDVMNWCYAGCGTAAGAVAIFLLHRFGPRIRAWRAAWRQPARRLPGGA